MSMDIGPGDWVECINDRPSSDYATGAYLQGGRIVAGRLYVVQEVISRNVYRSGHVDDRQGFVLTAPETHWTAWTGKLGGWDQKRFRPIHRGNTNLIESLKEIAGKPLVCDPA